LLTIGLSFALFGILLGISKLRTKIHNDEINPVINYLGRRKLLLLAGYIAVSALPFSFFFWGQLKDTSYGTLIIYKTYSNFNMAITYLTFFALILIPIFIIYGLHYSFNY
jgi:hypothetical protein